MRRKLGVLFCVLLGAPIVAQPYLDVANGTLTYSPERLQRWELGISVPLPIGKGSDKIILSPFWEEWKTTVPPCDQPVFAQRTDRLTGWALPITWLNALKDEHWKIILTGIIRHNHIGPLDRGDYQLGGAFLATYGRKPALTWKAGCYMNGDAFGLFWLPLLGIDWRIDAKHNIWGVLPGTMHYEHKAFERFHWGIAFKAFTNSYGLRNGDLRRVDENQIGLFGDLYMIKGNIVLRLEGGHTALSQYQGGELDPRYAALGEGQYVDHHVPDGPYMKVMLAFRVRLDREPEVPNELPTGP